MTARSGFHSSPARRVGALAIASLVLLGGCGGSGGGADSGGASVLSMSASPVRYGSTMTITVSGRGLGQAVELTVDGNCTDVTRIAGTSEETVQWTCVVRALGELVPRVRNSETRRELGSVKVNVPVPRVSITATDGTRTGTVVIELDPVAAPATVENFLAYVNSGTTSFYRSTLFHKVNPDVGVFAGAYTNGTSNSLVAKASTRPAFALESNNGLKNVRGTVAMVRTSASDAGTSQFLINTSDNTQFDRGADDNPPGYTVFGRVVDGLNVVDEIRAVATGYDVGQAINGVPTTPVSISAISQTR